MHVNRIACHDCDQLQLVHTLMPGESAVCARCGSLLARSGRDVAERTFAYASASLILFIVANVTPFMEFKIAGRVQIAYLSTGVQQLWADGYGELAVMVAFTSILAPVVLIGGLLAISSAMMLRRRPSWLVVLTRLISRLKVWAMMEVFLLGVIVSAIKLGQMAHVSFDVASLAFVALILSSTAALAAYDPAAVWDYLDGEDPR
ncbi:MAG: hypothetical protein DHS20C15_32410 [Planctomycetota bacterium]|nr:MAG: hypothetical protein DHS20C15_32410 [Planctomycetota bacterium]